MEIVIRASIIFFFLLVLTRGMKKRTLADMAPFEMLLLVTLGDRLRALAEPAGGQLHAFGGGRGRREGGQ